MNVSNIQLGDCLKEKISTLLDRPSDFFEGDKWKKVCTDYMNNCCPLDDDFLWDFLYSSETNSPINAVSEIFEILGFPSDPNQHEQPYHGIRLFPLSTDRDTDTPEINRLLFIILFSWLKDRVKYYKEKKIKDHELCLTVMKEFYEVTVKLTKDFGDRYDIDYKLPDLEEKFIYLMCSHGCADLASGEIVSPNLATSREIKAGSKISNL